MKKFLKKLLMKKLMLSLKTNAKIWLNWLLKKVAENGDTVVMVGSVDGVEFCGKGETTLLNLFVTIPGFLKTNWLSESW